MGDLNFTHLDRLRAMAEDDGQSWDLSPNDKEAIRWAVDQAVAQGRAIDCKITHSFRHMQTAASHDWTHTVIVHGQRLPDGRYTIAPAGPRKTGR